MLSIAGIGWCWFNYSCFSFGQIIASMVVPRRPRKKIQRGAATVDIFTGSYIVSRRNWVCWGLLVFHTRTGTTEPCSKSRELKVCWNMICPHPAWKQQSSTAVSVQRRAETHPRNAVKEGCPGGLCLLAGHWSSRPAACPGISPWCTDWPTEKTVL